MVEVAANAMTESGRRVLVTGASRGIGRATALAFARRGWRLGLVSRPSQASRDTLEQCRRHEPGTFAVDADVTDDAATHSACEEAIERLGGVDVLVNNAGIGTYAPFAELSSDDWEQMLRVNVVGAANVVRAVLPTMLRQGAGHVVNMGSIRGIETIPTTTAYAASKFAVVGFTQALRQELVGTGVRVSLIHPGGVRTEFGRIPVAEKDTNFLEPEEIAEAVLGMVEVGGRAWVRDLTIVQAGYA